MITEDYVSYETAKLLKEKGFDSEEVGCHGGFYSETCYESGHGIITESGQEVGIVYDDLRNCDLDYNEYLRPTIQMAMKWLRDVHHLVIQIEFIDFLEHGEIWLYSIIERKTIKQLTGRDEDFTEHSYEEACESAIKYCLENLV